MMIDGYEFGSKNLPSEAVLQALIPILSSKHSPSSEGRFLTRNAVTSEVLPEIGPVAVKRYLRGGVIGNFINSLYLRGDKTRSQSEYEQMLNVGERGVKVPEPIMYVSKGSLFYRAWLVTRKISNSQTLAELSLADEDALQQPMQRLVEQVELLINNRILHVDLHPGNVLVNSAGEVFLVDFDKASAFDSSLQDLRDSYIFRWRRAVIKHRLPQYLCESFCIGLKSIAIS